MTDKISGILRTAGLAACILCIVYMLYFAVSQRAVASLEASGKRTLEIGMMAVTEGEVARAGDGCTVIRYYHEWDGTEYKRVWRSVRADLPEHARMPVIYSLGMGAGSCLVVGFYRKPMQILGVAGAVLLLLGVAMNFRKKGMEKWQEER